MKTTNITIQEAADFLRVSYRTMYRYLKEGKLPYTKPAGRVFIQEKDLIDFVNMRNR